MITLKTCISIGIILLLINNIDFSKFTVIFSQIRFKFILIAGLMVFLNFFFINLRWFLLLKSQEVGIGFLELAKINVIGYLFNNFLLGTNGGDYVKIFYIGKKTPAKKTFAITSVFLDRLTGFLSFLVIATVMCIISFEGPLKRNLLIFFGVCYVTVLLFFLFFNKGFMKKIMPAFVFEKFNMIKNIVSEVYDSVHIYRSKKIEFAKIFTVSIIAQFFLICSTYFVGVSLDIDIKFNNYLTFVPIIQTIASVPVSLSGLGLMEGSYVYFFKLLGCSVEKSFALSLVARGFSWLIGIIGIPFYIFAGIKKETK